MRLRCELGWHKWRVRWRYHARPITRPMLALVWPPLLAGPPFLAPTGVAYKTHWTRVGEECRHCGVKRP